MSDQALLIYFHMYTIHSFFQDLSENECESNVDVTFALDATESDSYAEQKEVVKQMIQRLASQAPNYRIGLLIYGSYAWQTKSLTQKMSIPNIVKLIDNLPLMGKTRKMDLALLTANTMFKPPAGSETPSVARILVFFASGAQTHGSMLPRDAARSLHDIGVKTIAVAMAGFSSDYLKDIVPTKSNLFNLPRKPQQGVEIFAKNLLSRVCKEARSCKCVQIRFVYLL